MERNNRDSVHYGTALEFTHFVCRLPCFHTSTLVFFANHHNEHSKPNPRLSFSTYVDLRPDDLARHSIPVTRRVAIERGPRAEVIQSVFDLVTLQKKPVEIARGVWIPAPWSPQPADTGKAAKSQRRSISIGHAHRILLAKAAITQLGSSL